MVPGTGAEAGAGEADVADGRGRSQCQLIDDIKEKWAYEREQQEELQKILADGADKHETTNWSTSGRGTLVRSTSAAGCRGGKMTSCGEWLLLWTGCSSAAALTA